MLQRRLKILCAAAKTQRSQMNVFLKRHRDVNTTLEISATGTHRRGVWSSFKRSEKAYQKKVKSERERSMFSAGQRMYRSLAGTCRRGWWSLQGGDKSESKKPTSEVKEALTRFWRFPSVGVILKTRPMQSDLCFSEMTWATACRI